MGNHQQHQEIAKIIDELQFIKQNSQYSTLKHNNGTQYIKFVYLQQKDHNQYHQLKASRTFSIFNNKYLQYRYQSQKVDNKKLNRLPKILAFGQENQNNKNFISCSYQNFNFVIIQHPTRNLKQQIQERITSGNSFEQIQLLNLIKSVIQGSIQLYQHIKSWNQQILERKKFLLTQENILIDASKNFIMSDIFSSFHQIQSMIKQQVTLKRSSRSVSLTNLHSKVSNKKLKQNFFLSNFNNLASIIDGIMFKFQCFGNNGKNSFQQSQSMSTALESYRGANKNSIQFSNQFQQILKQLRKGCIDQHQALENVNRTIENIHGQNRTHRQKINYQQTINSKKSSLQQQVFQRITLKLNSNCYKSQNNNNTNLEKRKPLLQIILQNSSNMADSVNKFSFISKNTLNNSKNRFFSQVPQNQTINNSIRTSQLANNQNRSLNKNNTKIRLSLKKDSSRAAVSSYNNQNKQNLIIAFSSDNKKLNRKQSHPKYLCIQNKQNQQMQKQQQIVTNNYVSNKVNSAFSLDKKRSSTNLIQQKQSQNYSLITPAVVPQQNISNNKLYTINSKQNNKRKVLLKKPTDNPTKQIYQCSSNMNSLQQKKLKQNIQTSSHMNPIYRKKNLGFGKHNIKILHNKKQPALSFKTADKGLNQGIDIQLIQNLSSIISNHNNTVSSYGNPLTDQFRTQNSQVQQQGCVGFAEAFDNIERTKDHQNLSNKLYLQLQKHKKTISPKLQKSTKVNLSSYPSIQLVQSIIQRPQDKIPQFLKQFNLPQKHLVALNNIILKQKDMIMEQSFEQSQFNSFRKSIPNVLALQEEINELKKKRKSKILADLIGLQMESEMIFKQEDIKSKLNGSAIKQGSENQHLQFSSIKINQEGENYQNIYQKQSILYQKYDDSLTRGFRQIQFSLNNS